MENVLEALAEKIGISLARMHAQDVVHGDLTTSNLMLRDSNESLVIVIIFFICHHQGIIIKRLTISPYLFLIYILIYIYRWSLTLD